MVSTRTRRRRRSRFRHSQDFGFASTASSRRLRIFLLVPLIALSIFLLFSKFAEIRPLEAALTQPAFLSSAWVPTLAQASLPAPLTQQGTQIVLNGRSISAPWSQRQQKIGIADTGADAKPSESICSTAVIPPLSLWNGFSDPQRDLLSLSTWLTGQYRYLDITELAQRFGWQVRSTQSALANLDPSSHNYSDPAGTTGLGAIELRSIWIKPTPWQMTEDRGSATITIDAKIDPATVRSFYVTRGVIASKKAIVQQSGDRTVISLSVPDGVRPPASGR